MTKMSTHVLSTAYDRVGRKRITGSLGKSFREYGVDGRLFLAVKSLYSCS